MAGQLPAGYGQTKKGYGGVSFKTNLGSSGPGGSESRIFSSQGPNVIDEERRLIDKVFSIVDKDNSGTIDIEELKEMFQIFGVDTHYLTTAIQRILTNVDRDHDGTISPQEFYQLLSQKFEKKDVEDQVKCEEVRNVFKKMSDGQMNPQGQPVLTAESLMKVAQVLGEDIPKSELHDMIKEFNQDYQAQLKENKKNRSKVKNKAGQVQAAPKDPDPPTFMTMEDFLAAMREDLGGGPPQEDIPDGASDY